MEYSNSQIEKLIKGIEDGSITELDLPLDYYQALTKYLEKAVLEGFGVGFEAIATDPFLQELVTNVYMFGAAKTYNGVKAMSADLVDENGKVRTYKEFYDKARETYDTYNLRYLPTEYNTAIAQADSASKWQRIEQEKDVLPILEYSAIGDACDICQPLDGMTAPVDDPIWDSVAPTNHFNCKCIVLQHDENKSLTESPEDIVGPVVEQMSAKGQDIFINNVGKTGEIFTADHPYFDAPAELGQDNFGLPLPNFEEE
jgi:SPP1 gp7 family putative phage head morphogenesis protein